MAWEWTGKSRSPSKGAKKYREFDDAAYEQFMRQFYDKDGNYDSNAYDAYNSARNDDEGYRKYELDRHGRSWFSTDETDRREFRDSYTRELGKKIKGEIAAKAKADQEAKDKAAKEAADKRAKHGTQDSGAQQTGGTGQSPTANGSRFVEEPQAIEPKPEHAGGRRESVETRAIPANGVTSQQLITSVDGQIVDRTKTEQVNAASRRFSEQQARHARNYADERRAEDSRRFQERVARVGALEKGFHENMRKGRISSGVVGGRSDWESLAGRQYDKDGNDLTAAEWRKGGAEYNNAVTALQDRFKALGKLQSAGYLPGQNEIVKQLTGMMTKSHRSGLGMTQAQIEFANKALDRWERSANERAADIQARTEVGNQLAMQKMRDKYGMSSPSFTDADVRRQDHLARGKAIRGLLDTLANPQGENGTERKKAYWDAVKGLQENGVGLATQFNEAMKDPKNKARYLEAVRNGGELADLAQIQNNFAIEHLRGKFDRVDRNRSERQAVETARTAGIDLTPKVTENPGGVSLLRGPSDRAAAIDAINKTLSLNAGPQQPDIAERPADDGVSVEIPGETGADGKTVPKGINPNEFYNVGGEEPLKNPLDDIKPYEPQKPAPQKTFDDDYLDGLIEELEPKPAGAKNPNPEFKGDETQKGSDATGSRFGAMAAMRGGMVLRPRKRRG